MSEEIVDPDFAFSSFAFKLNVSEIFSDVREMAVERTEDDLKRAAQFVQYEYEHFRWAIDAIDPEWRLGTGSADNFKDDAIVEGALLHARILRDFFTKRRSESRKDDILAEDFFENKDYWSIPVLPYLSDNKERLDRALAHFSYSRIDYSQNPLWDFEKTASDIDGAWERFMSKLPASRIGWFVRNPYEDWMP